MKQKKITVFLLFLPLLSGFLSAETKAGTFGFDTAINLSLKSGPGIGVSFHWKVLDSLSVDFHGGGFPGATVGFGCGVTYYPLPNCPYIYLSPAISYVGFGGDTAGQRSLTTDLFAISVNAGVESPSFPLGMLFFSSNTEVKLPTTVFVEAGCAKFLNVTERENGVITYSGSTFRNKQWWYPNFIFGLRQFSIERTD